MRMNNNDGSSNVHGLKYAQVKTRKDEQVGISEIYVSDFVEI